jgi:hypothetical protein
MDKLLLILPLLACPLAMAAMAAGAWALTKVRAARERLPMPEPRAPRQEGV